MTFTDLTFEENFTGGSGGALYMDDNASQYGAGTTVSIYDSKFINSSADLKAGAVALYNSNTTLELYNVSFEGNTAEGEGSSIDLGYSSTIILSDDQASTFDVEPFEDGGSISDGEMGDLPPPPQE